MKMLVAGAVLAALVAPPAFAQSYDPDLGTGNIVPWSDSTTYTGNTGHVPQRGHSGLARVAPGGAQSPYSAYGAVTPFGSPVDTRNGGNHSGVGARNGENHSAAAREKALRECTEVSRRYLQTTWGNMESLP